MPIQPILDDVAAELYRTMLQSALAGHQAEMMLMEKRIVKLEEGKAALVEEIRRYTASKVV